MVAALLLAACGSGFDRDAAVANVQVENPDVSEDQAGCVVDRLVDRFGLDGVESGQIADPTPPEFEDAQIRDMFGCGVEGDLQELIAEQLADAGVAADDAPCVADALTVDLTDGDLDVLVSGDITEEFATKFLDAMVACGAIDS